MTRKSIEPASVRRLLVSVAMLAAWGMRAASAQQSPESESLEEVVVTATGTNISGVAPVGSETVTIDREQMLSLGAADIADVVRSLPQAQTLGFDNANRGNNKEC